MSLGNSIKSALGLASGPKGNFTSGEELVGQQERLNRYNINSAVGSRSFSTDSSGRSVLNINETPAQKQIRELQEGLAVDTLSSRAYGAADFENLSNQARDATYNSAYNLISPDIEKERTALETSLINRGLNPGTDAYKNAYEQFDRRKSSQINQLSLQSVLAGNQERDNLIRNAELTRAARLAEAGGTTQGIDLGIFGDVAQIDAAGIISGQENASNAYALSRFQDTQKRRADFTTGIIKGAAQLGSSAIAASSDINLKENIAKVDEQNGFNIYEFNYKNSPERRYRGVMAQEVEQIKPEAVTRGEDGYLAVFYDMIGLKMLEV